MAGPTFERLRGIKQAGPSALAFPFKQVTRYEHSLGVYILLGRLGAGRKERIAGVWGKPEPRYVTLRFRRLSDEARKRLPWWQVATFNNAGIQVWEYPGSKPEGIAGTGRSASPSPVSTHVSSPAPTAPGGVALRNAPNPNPEASR